MFSKQDLHRDVPQLFFQAFRCRFGGWWARNGGKLDPSTYGPVKSNKNFVSSGRSFFKSSISLRRNVDDKRHVFNGPPFLLSNDLWLTKKNFDRIVESSVRSENNRLRSNLFFIFSISYFSWKRGFRDEDLAKEKSYSTLSRCRLQESASFCFILVWGKCGSYERVA